MVTRIRPVATSPDQCVKRIACATPNPWASDALLSHPEQQLQQQLRHTAGSFGTAGLCIPIYGLLNNWLYQLLMKTHSGVKRKMLEIEKIMCYLALCHYGKRKIIGDQFDLARNFLVLPIYLSSDALCMGPGSSGKDEPDSFLNW